jgi:hypothetical protein
MPPKAAPVAAAPVVEKNFQLEIEIVQALNFDNEKAIKVRIFSEWLECCGTTPQFGLQEALPWENSGDGKVSAKFRTSFEAYFPNDDKLVQFHNHPGLYFTVLNENKDGNSLNATPLAYLYLDCSSLLYGKKSLAVQKRNVSGIHCRATVNITKEIMPLHNLIKFEPLLLDISW